MSTTSLRALAIIPTLLATAVLADPPKPADKAPADKTPPAVKRTEMGKNIVLETQGETRRVRVPAVVSFREGPLELFMCRKNTKEHEAVVSADIDARQLHAALLVAGAKAGSPVKYEPKYQAASGTPIKVSIEYQKDGKTVTVPAQSWIRDGKTRKEMTHPWVFAGSIFFPDPDDPKKPPLYAANSGDVICVSNFPDAMLDIPVSSPQDDNERVFEAFTDRIPALGTAVTVILEPVAEKKK